MLDAHARRDHRLELAGALNSADIDFLSRQLRSAWLEAKNSHDRPGPGGEQIRQAAATCSANSWPTSPASRGDVPPGILPRSWLTGPRGQERGEKAPRRSVTTTLSK